MYKINLIPYFFIFLIGYSGLARSQSLLSTGLEISVTGDMVSNLGFNDEYPGDDKVTMRGAELMLYAPIDYQFDGFLSAVAHDENGVTNFELHELYISSSRLIPRSYLRFGQFFMNIGRLNRFHQHDWPFTRAPKVHRTFFDDEGIYDTGLEYSYILPTTHTINLNLGLTSGYRYGHSHTKGSKPKVPTHYGRLTSFFPFSSTNGLETGLNYLGRTDAQNNQLQIIGLDVTAKWREARLISTLIQSEFWYKTSIDDFDKTAKEVGFYIFNNFSTGQQSSFGYRLDMYKDLTKINSVTNKKINNISYGGLIQATYISSEFSKIRATISHEFDREEGISISRDTRFALQLFFIIGSHPAHDF